MTRDHTLAAEALTLAYGDRAVLRELDLAVPPGRITAIVGANASGKSTLLRSMSRLLAPRGGQVVLDGRSVHRMPAKELARTLGLLPQSPIAPEGITVADLVGRGRHPHQGIFTRWTREDDAAVAAALEATATTDLADRAVDELSGGQRQRVWIAMALAQQTDLLLLDEPTTFLDVSHQVEVLDLLTDLNRNRGTTVVMVLHDLNLAARYADHLVALADGDVHAAGDPTDVLTEDCVRAVFGLDSRIVVDPTSDRPLMLPIGRHHMAGALPRAGARVNRAERLPGYREAPQLVWDKEIDRIDRHCRAFIGLSPWLTLATADADGFPDVSPRGGRPGFVEVLDEHRLALPDRPGNNRVDSLRNVLVNPQVALMLVVPGIEETLRVYGTAAVRAPADVDADLTEFGRAPRSVLVVDVQRAFFQCAKSLMRSGLWEPERWPGRGDFASIGQVFRDHCDLPAPLPPDEVMRADMAQEL